MKFEARSVPGSSKLVLTAAAHHSICGGTLCLLDRRRGTEGDAPLTRLTPEVPFPETEANGGHYYANPWPLSEQYFLVGWADKSSLRIAGLPTNGIRRMRWAFTCSTPLAATLARMPILTEIVAG